MPDKLAVIQSEESIKELQLIQNQTDELIKTFTTLVETTDKVGKNITTPKELLAAQKELVKVEKEYISIIEKKAKIEAQVSAITTKALIDEQKLRKETANATNAEARASIQVERQKKAEAKATQQATSEYEKLNKAHIEARNAAREAALQHGILSREFLKAAAEANRYDQQLKRIDGSLGQFQRNVGNYNGNMWGLSAQMQQVMREMPNFAMDARIGFMALSNNLPLLGDAISEVREREKQLKEEFKAAAAEARNNAIQKELAAGADMAAANAAGKHAEAMVMQNYQASKAPSLWKQLASSIFSWQSLLIVGISLLVQYSDEISELVKSLFKANDATAIAKKNTEDLNAARKEAAKSAAQEISQLETLYRVATNEALSREQRLRATDKLQKIYPSYFKNMSDEQIMLGRAEKAYLSLKDAILASARARAAEKIIEKRTGDNLEQLEKTKIVIENEYKVIEQIKKLRNKGQKEGRILLGESVTGNEVWGTVNLDRQEKISRDNIKKYATSIRKNAIELNNANSFLAKQIAGWQETAAPYEADKYGVDPAKDNSEAERKKREREAAAAARKAESERKRQEREHEQELKRQYDAEKDAIEKLYAVRMEAKNNNIELAKKDPYSSETDKINNQIQYYSDLIKANDDYYNALIENAKKYGQNAAITDLEKARDTKNLDLQGKRDEAYLGMSDAYQKDVEYTQKIEDNIREAKNLEEQRKIIQNSRLSDEEKEYQLSQLDLKQKRENLEIEKSRIEEESAMLASKASIGILTRDELARVIELGNEYENVNTELAKTKKNIEKLQLEKLQSLGNVLADGFRNMGFDSLADQITQRFSKMYEDLKKGALDWKDAMAVSSAFIADMTTQAVESSKDRRIAALDEELKRSQESTEQEIGFIESRMEWLNSLGELSKEQIEERNALEDEARVLREQQQEREKMIAAQKAKAIQSASAQQTLISGIQGAVMAYLSQLIPGDPTSILRGYAAAAATLGFAALNAGLIMSKDPVPKYFVGRDGGKAEWAWTQEKGREIITDKYGNIKDFGSDGGAKMTWLDKDDKVYTAEDTKKLLAELSMDRTPELFGRIARQSFNTPVIVHNSDNSDKIIHGFENALDRKLSKYDKVTYFEDEDGNIYSQNGGQYPIFRGKKRQPKIEIKIKNNDTRD